MDALTVEEMCERYALTPKSLEQRSANGAMPPRLKTSNGYVYPIEGVSKWEQEHPAAAERLRARGMAKRPDPLQHNTRIKTAAKAIADDITDMMTRELVNHSPFTYRRLNTEMQIFKTLVAISHPNIEVNNG